MEEEVTDCKCGCTISSKNHYICRACDMMIMRRMSCVYVYEGCLSGYNDVTTCGRVCMRD